MLERTNICPRTDIGLEEGHWLTLFRHYQSGHLYDSGGVAEQPALYLRVMRMIEAVANESKESK